MLSAPGKEPLRIPIGNSDDEDERPQRTISVWKLPLSGKVRERENKNKLCDVKSDWTDHEDDNKRMKEMQLLTGSLITSEGG